MALQYSIVPVTPFEQNCSVLWCDETHEGIVVDAGGDIPKIQAAIEGLGITIKALVLTHGHLDHVGGALELSKQLGVHIIGPHKDDAFWLDMLPQQAQMFQFGTAEVLTPNQWLDEGDQVSFGNVVLDVFHCPGHTPGHVVLVDKTARRAFVGDVLFKGSIGRTDFPKGDFQTLVDSIRQKLWPLGDDIIFVPGHGPESTFGHERQTNPFVASRHG